MEPIEVKYNKNLSIINIKQNIFDIIDYYGNYTPIIWYLIQNINSKDKVIYYYIYTLDNIYINLRKINFILENFICLNKDLYISISCYPEKIFKKEDVTEKDDIKQRIQVRIICLLHF